MLMNHIMIDRLLLNDHLDLADEISKVHSTYESCIPQIEQLRADDALEIPSVLETGDGILIQPPIKEKDVPSTDPPEDKDKEMAEQLVDVSSL